MPKFPVDAPREKVLKAFALLGFKAVRKGAHTSLARENPDGSTTPMTIPNHQRIKSATLRAVCTQAGISREEFLRAFEKA